MTKAHNTQRRAVSAIKAVNARYSIFVRGYKAALTNQPFKLGELIYTGAWEQIAFERGWAFGREILRTHPVPFPNLKGRSLPKQYYRHINKAVAAGVII